MLYLSLYSSLMSIRSYSLIFSSLFFLGLCSSKTLADTPLTAAQSAAQAAPKLTIATVPVGDINNPPDISLNAIGMLARYPYGCLTNSFCIGTYDTMASEYVRFLNAVASSSDPNELYDPRMSTDADVASISRSGTPGNYTYAVKGFDTARLPIVYVSWFCSARYANWLCNGQPVGIQDSTTTETGAYNLAAPVIIKNAQRYATFLNAVAKTDTHNLYESTITNYILQQGASGSFVYSVTTAGKVPGASFGVTWPSGARFLNWEYNTNADGTPKTAGNTGDKLTENGLYVIATGMRDIAGNADVAPTDYCALTPGAKFYLPSEDQYYKAAFYKRNVDTNNQLTAEYWMYPTKNDFPPGNVIGAPNAVNYYVSTNQDNTNSGWFSFNHSNYKFTNLGLAPYLTAAGAFYNASGPYGTFDMGGNVSQWLNAPAGNASSTRPIRGGGWGKDNQWPVGSDQLSKNKGAASVDASLKRDYIGFRIATP
jgi:hypothetical protein